MITAPQSLSASTTISLKCSHALPIHANTSDGSSFLSAINPSSETERPNMTFPIVFSDLALFPRHSRALFDQPNADSRRDKRAPHAVQFSRPSSASHCQEMVQRSLASEQILLL